MPENIRVTDVPAFMQIDSFGVGPIALQSFLCGMNLLKGPFTHGLYDQATGDGVREFQVTWGLDVDGHCGPQTRKTMKDIKRFDLEEICRAARNEKFVTTSFVQPDGSIHHY